ncbi:RNA-directed DNA polymerase from mobile element jockey [Trichonephila clavipes]|nr:RNA-directed DNA polymerase from mobile element jockey [Trichonephila clavipes]
MSKKSLFAIFKALQAIVEPKSVKKMRSVTPHISLNTCRGVISESDLLTIPDAEILDGFSDQGVIQVRRITIKNDATVIPAKHLILTFNSPNLPATIKAGYLNCKIRPYIPNPLRCFKCQRFGHSQTSCRGQLTCSRCATVGHPSMNCTLEPKCVNCTQSHSSDSKLCSKWKTEKEIQAIKTNRNITYLEARKLIVPQLSQTYAKAAKSSNKNSCTQTDENITKVKCPPLKLFQPLSSISEPNISITTPVISTSSSTQAEFLPSTSSTESIVSEPQPPIPVSSDTLSTTNNMFTPVGSSSVMSASSSGSSIQHPSESSTIPDFKKNAKTRARKRKNY